MRSAVKVMPVAVDIDNNDRYLGIVTVELKSVAEFNDNDAAVSDGNTAISTAFGVKRTVIRISMAILLA